MQIRLPKLEEYQKAVLDFHIDNPTRNTIVVTSPRQVGKSTFLEILLVYASMSEKHSKSIAISPIFPQSRKLYEDVVAFAKPIIKKCNSSVLEIKFINESTIRFASAEQGDNLRGFTCKKSGICVLDEAAFIKKDFYYNVVVPFTNVYGGNIYLFSTPRFKDGLFWELYNQGLDNEFPNIYTFNWTDWDLSKFLTPEILDLYRNQLPKLTFQCEYLAQFIDSQGTVFPDFKKNVGNYELTNAKELYITIDWGTGNGNDDTVIAYGQIDSHKLKISHLDAFNDKSPTITIDYILKSVKRKVKEGFRVINITVEKNSIGNIYFDMLYTALDEYECGYNDKNWKDEIEINCNTFVTSNQSKKRAVEQLELLFEKELIIIPNDEKLLKQLSMFESRIDKNTNTVFYAGANNSHDDCVLAILFMVNKTYQELNI